MEHGPGSSQVDFSIGLSSPSNACSMSSILLWIGPRIAILLHLPVIRVKGRLQGDESGQAARHFRNIADFIGLQATAKERFLPARQPLLDDLVTADGVVPYRIGYVPPACDVV
jgi:hypothetical protein